MLAPRGWWFLAIAFGALLVAVSFGVGTLVAMLMTLLAWFLATWDPSALPTLRSEHSLRQFLQPQLDGKLRGCLNGGDTHRNRNRCQWLHRYSHRNYFRTYRLNRIHHFSQWRIMRFANQWASNSEPNRRNRTLPL